MRLKIVLATVLGIGVASGTVIAGSAVFAAGDEETSPVNAAVSAVTPAFSALADPPSSPAPPFSKDESVVLDRFAGIASSLYNPDIARTHETRTIPGGARVLAVPGKSSVCVVVLGVFRGQVAAPFSCSNTEDANADGVTLTYGEKGDTTIVGLVPDGVDSVTTEAAGGARATVKVQSNSYVITGQDSPFSLTYDGNGQATKRVSLR